MPSSRRRRFSVQNKISDQEISKSQNGTQISNQDEVNLTHNMKTLAFKNKIHPCTSKKLSVMDTECKSPSKLGFHTCEKEVTASSSNINLYTIINASNTLIDIESTLIDDKINKNGLHRRDKTPHRDNYLHRAKVRSPKRKVNKENKKKSIGISVNLNSHIELKDDSITKLKVIEEAVDVEGEEQISSQSLEDMCRICHSGDAASDAGNLISACLCRGTIGRVHVKCLERWLTESGKSRCELCGTKYITRRVHRFGIFKALVMWILSHNSKNMIVDIFGIMIMTPIAVVGASLTEKTLSGLMAQEHKTPWPLASTFVLACMTLVCYYCWIVSALTRHALGWWVWYRSHYEVRLQLQEDEE